MAYCSTTSAAGDLRRAGNSDAEIKKMAAGRAAAVFHRYAIVDRRIMPSAIHKFECYRAEQAAARDENEQSRPF